MILVTGGAGFIGSNLVAYMIESGETVLNLDKLTYAGNLHNVSSINSDRHIFVEGDIGNQELVSQLLTQYNPRAVINLAAESHVDRSIHDPESFIQTNIVGAFRLLKASHVYWADLPNDQKSEFRFLHISTDEVTDASLRRNRHSARVRHTRPTALMRQARPPQTIWCAHFFKPMACPY